MICLRPLKDDQMILKVLILFVLVSICAPGLKAAELFNLTGSAYSGSLKSLSQSSAVIQTKQGDIEVPADQIMKITFPAENGQPETVSDSYIRVTITDHSELAGSTVKSDGQHLSITTEELGKLQIPAQKVKSVLFSKLDDNLRTQWELLTKKESRDDLLVIKKGETLDFLPGVVTQFDDTNVLFLYEGNEIPVRREKVFGIIHPHPYTPAEQVICRIETTAGNSLFVQEISLEDDTFRVRTGPDHFITIPKTQMRLIDFSLGRIVYLSDMPHESVEYTPYFDVVWEYQRDKTIDGSALKLGNQEYSKGLWIHSKTRLTYRLAGDFSRFQALIGIDASVAESGLGHVHVVITADEKVLFEEDISAFTAPQKIDLDITGHRFLSLLVDFGEGLNIGDRLDLVEARLIK